MIRNILIYMTLSVTVNSCLLSQNGTYQLDLFKDNLSWTWLGRLNFNGKINSKTHFTLEDQYASNLFLETVWGNKWRDENNLKGFIKYDFSNPFKTATQFRSHVFSDENAFVKFSKNIIYQEIEYAPISRVKVAPAFGWASEDIYSFRDQGWYSQLNSSVDGYDIGGYSNTTRGFSSLYFYPNRKNREHRYFTSFQKQFSALAKDSLQVGYEFIDNSYPIPSIESQAIRNLEEVGINSRYLYNELNYKLFSLSYLTVETKLQTRDITQSNLNLHNHRKELNFANRIGWYYESQRFLSGFVFSTSQMTTLASRRPIGSEESRTDIDGLQSAFNLFFHLKERTDESRISFSFTKYEYSSPDTSQNIDEDDLRFVIDFMYLHRFSPYFSLELGANVYLYHQIYIHRNRSANNNWNRIFSISSSFTHTLPRFLEHSFKMFILANYTVYDFEDILLEVRSYLFRKLVYSDSLRLRISSGLALHTLYQLEKEDNGTFYKDIFAQQISSELISHYIDVALVYTRIKGIQVIMALNWFFRKEWGMMPERRMIRDFRAISPRLAIKYDIGRNLYLYLSFSPRSYQDLNTRRKYFTMGKVDLKYYF
jgi:hypothetical protein